MIIDIRKAAFLCITIGLSVGAGILTVFLVSTERSPFLLEQEMRICSVENCNNKYWAKGLCQKHWNKQYRQDNKEYCLEYSKQYYQNNKEKYKKLANQYYLIHKEQMDNYRKQWRKDNKEHMIKYREDNKEKEIKQGKQWREDNEEHCREYNKQYRQTLSGKASSRARSQNRRTLLKDLTKETVQRVYEDNVKKYGVLTCYLCFKPIINNDDSLDHSTPLIRGGSNNYKNLGIAHLSCNNQKYTKTLSEWFKEYKRG